MKKITKGVKVSYKPNASHQEEAVRVARAFQGFGGSQKCGGGRRVVRKKIGGGD